MVATSSSLVLPGCAWHHLMGHVSAALCDTCGSLPMLPATDRAAIDATTTKPIRYFFMNSVPRCGSSVTGAASGIDSHLRREKCANGADIQRERKALFHGRLSRLRRASKRRWPTRQNIGGSFENSDTVAALRECSQAAGCRKAPPSSAAAPAPGSGASASPSAQPPATVPARATDAANKMRANEPAAATGAAAARRHRALAISFGDKPEDRPLRIGIKQDQ